MSGELIVRSGLPIPSSIPDHLYRTVQVGETTHEGLAQRITLMRAYGILVADRILGTSPSYAKERIELSLAHAKVPVTILTPRELGFSIPPTTKDLLYDKDRQRFFGKQVLRDATISGTHPEVVLQYSWQFTDQPVGERLWGATEMVMSVDVPNLILLQNVSTPRDEEHPSTLQIGLEHTALTQVWGLDVKFLWEIIPL